MLRHSIVRRSVVVTGAYLLGHALNYALMFEANRLLDAGGFGLFYTSVLVITVTMSPLVAATLVLGRLLTTVGTERGRSGLISVTLRLFKRSVVWGVPAALASGGTLAVAGSWLGIEGWQIALLLPMTVLALVLAELLRAGFQSLFLFRWSSALWVVGQAAQFGLAVTGLALLKGVWPGILGILAGAALTSAGFSVWFLRQARRVASTVASAPTLRLWPEMPFVVSYSLFVLVNNLDILVGYWLLPRVSLDIYAASALLPKAIITATFPVAQVVLPVIVERHADGLSVRVSLLKALGLAAAMGATAAAILWGVMPIMQGTPLAIRGLDLGVMKMLALGAVGLGAARVLVVAEIALRRYFIGLLQLGAAVAFIGFAAAGRADAASVARLYAAVCWGFLFVATLWAVAMVRPAVARMSNRQEQESIT